MNVEGLNLFLHRNKNGIGNKIYELAQLCLKDIKCDGCAKTFSKNTALIFKRYGCEIEQSNNIYIIKNKTKEVSNEKNSNS